MNKKVLIITIAVVVAFLIFFIALFIFPGTLYEENNESEFEEELILYSYDMGDAFITNMKDSSRFIKVSIVLEVSSEEQVTYLGENDYMIRDKVIEILRSKTHEEYKKENIQEKLKEEIKKELKRILEIDAINSVYFKEFVIQ